MRSFALIAAAAGLVAAGDWSNGHGHDNKSWGTGISYITETVSSYTTYCPGPTEISHAGKTYTVTTATTLTLDCPCTVTKPVSVTSAPSAPSVVVPTGGPVVTKSATPSSAPAKVSSYFPSVAAPSSTAAATTSAPATYTGSANKLQAAGAGLLAVMAAAAAL